MVACLRGLLSNRNNNINTWVDYTVFLVNKVCTRGSREVLKRKISVGVDGVSGG